MNWRLLEVLTVCQQLVLTAFRYPNLSETTNGPKKGKNIPPPPYNLIIEISIIGYIIEMLRNVIKTLQIPPTITVSVC